MRNAVKFYKFLDTSKALLFKIYARQLLHLSNRIARLNFRQPPSDFIAD